MRILYLNTLYAPNIGGGAEITLKTLVETMAARGHDVCVLTTGPGPWLQVDKVDGIRVIRIGVHNLYWHFERAGVPQWKRAVWHFLDIYNPAMARAVRQVVTEFKPDVVSCHNLAGFSASIWSALSAAGVPLVQVLHDYYSLCPTSNMFRRGHSCTRPCTRCRILRLPHARLSSNVSAVVGISRFILDRHLENKRFAGVSVRTVIPNARRGKIAPPRLIAPEGKLRFGFIGTLAPAKGVELLLDAYASLPPGGHALHVAGRGEPEYERHLQARASLGVTFMGNVGAADFFSAIDVLIVPSLWQEPLGMVIVEAFMHGVPVLASRVGGIPELVEEGRNGWLFDPTCPGELLARMRALLAQEAKVQSCIEGALASANVHVDVDAWARRYESLLRQVLTVDAPAMACH